MSFVIVNIMALLLAWISTLKIHPNGCSKLNFQVKIVPKYHKIRPKYIKLHNYFPKAAYICHPPPTILVEYTPLAGGSQKIKKITYIYVLKLICPVFGVWLKRWKYLEKRTTVPSCRLTQDLRKKVLLRGFTAWHNYYDNNGASDKYISKQIHKITTPCVLCIRIFLFIYRTIEKLYWQPIFCSSREHSKWQTKPGLPCHRVGWLQTALNQTVLSLDPGIGMYQPLGLDILQSKTCAQVHYQVLNLVH